MPWYRRVRLRLRLRRFSAVGGGYYCKVKATAAVLAGGFLNSITYGGYYSAVGGGAYNTVTSGYSSVGGGISNVASAFGTTIAGGQWNQVSGRRASEGESERSSELTRALID